MSYLARYILGAANEDYENWMQMIVFVIVGLFWVIGGILKARANKLKDRNEPETEEPRGKAGLERPGSGSVKTAYAQRQAVVRHRVVQARPQAQPSYGTVIRPQAVAEPKVTGPKEALRFWPLPRVESLKTPAKKITPTEPEKLLKLDLDNTEQLKKAILYYEILGKPVALRDM